MYTKEKMLKEVGDKASETDRNETEEKLEALKKAIAADETDAMKKSADELATVAQKIGAAMYQAAQAQEAASTPSSSTEQTADADKEGPAPVEGDFTQKT